VGFRLKGGGDSGNTQAKQSKASLDATGFRTRDGDTVHNVLRGRRWAGLAGAMDLEAQFDSGLFDREKAKSKNTGTASGL
jgi:hypothetical protein